MYLGYYFRKYESTSVQRGSHRRTTLFPEDFRTLLTHISWAGPSEALSDSNPNTLYSLQWRRSSAFWNRRCIPKLSANMSRQDSTISLAREPLLDPEYHLQFCLYAQQQQHYMENRAVFPSVIPPRPFQTGNISRWHSLLALNCGRLQLLRWEDSHFHFSLLNSAETFSLYTRSVFVSIARPRKSSIIFRLFRITAVRLWLPWTWCALLFLFSSRLVQARFGVVF